MKVTKLCRKLVRIFSNTSPNRRKIRREWVWQKEVVLLIVASVCVFFHFLPPTAKCIYYVQCLANWRKKCHSLCLSNLKIWSGSVIKTRFVPFKRQKNKKKKSRAFCLIIASICILHSSRYILMLVFYKGSLSLFDTYYDNYHYNGIIT